jgi:DNA repair ATPase RecN
MKNELDLARVINAFDELEFEQRTTTNLENARNKSQMRTYIQTLDFSLRRLKILQETINELVEDKQSDLVRQEKVQTYKTKIINLSRQYNISYQDVINIMAKLKK